MESLLSGSKLADELAYMKTFAAVLATQKVVIPSNYVPPPEDRPKRATLVNIPVCQPPAKMEVDETATTSEAQISITVKCSKPSISVTLSCSPTSTIASLKAALSKREPSAPGPELQRWILKGKAMSDTKLLKEFDIKDGAVVNLMVSKASNAPASSTTTATNSDDPPALTLTTDEVPDKQTRVTAVDTPASASAAATIESDEFVKLVADPKLWTATLASLRSHFSSEQDAVKVWEAWLSSSLPWLSASDKARIREQVGVTAMGGQ